MSVDIEPFELSFRRPFNVEVSQILRIKNPNSTPVAFKVKTTAPKQYCVRPNAGRIEPGQDFDVTVLLQAMKLEPKDDAKCRDKFLVQSAPITSDKEFSSIGSVLDTSDKSSVVERKIRVNWLPPSGDAPSDTSALLSTPSKNASGSVSGNLLETPEAPRTFSSPRAVAETSPAPQTYDAQEAPEEVEEKSAVAQAAATVTSAAQVTYEELKAKLTQAEAQIASLKDSGLRQRNVKAGGEKETKVAQLAQAVPQSVSGVPVQITALLCFLTFLIAYFFF